MKTINKIKNIEPEFSRSIERKIFKIQNKKKRGEKLEKT
jgi:hypothetical protein